ncbi:MAG TPA: hypothetical protein VID75_00585 [Acidimicrobiales bacterium]
MPDVRRLGEAVRFGAVVRLRDVRPDTSGRAARFVRLRARRAPIEESGA